MWCGKTCGLPCLPVAVRIQVTSGVRTFCHSGRGTQPSRRVNGAVRPGPPREQIDYTLLSPETVKVLRGGAPTRSVPQNATASRPHRSRQTPAQRDEGYER